MAAEAIKIRATAAKLYKETGDEAIEGYKTMPLDDLKTHIERIQSGAKGTAKGKTATSTNGAGATRQKGKATPAAAMPAKGKGKPATTATKGKGSASTSAPAKSTAQKSTPAKGKAAQGTAKRPTTAAAKGKGSTPTKGKTTPAKGRTAPAKPAASKPARASRKPAAQVTGRAEIDNKAVNWKAESNIGRTGKRAEVMAGLRRYKGDKAKVFELLAPKARTFYKGRTKNEAERMLVWLIGRVAFDFVTATGQHEMGTRAAYGTASDPKNIRRRERREEARKAAEKEARAAKRAASAASTTASKGKAPAKRTATTKGKGK